MTFKYEDETTEQYIWIGKDTVVVQVGDQVDRCRPIGDGKKCVRDREATVDDEHSDLKIIDLFNELNKLAMVENGMVISLLGNHELMNYQGNINYASYKGVHNDDFEGKNQNNKYRKDDGTSFDDGINISGSGNRLDASDADADKYLEAVEMAKCVRWLKEVHIYFLLLYLVFFFF